MDSLTLSSRRSAAGFFGARAARCPVLPAGWATTRCRASRAAASWRGACDYLAAILKLVLTVNYDDIARVDPGTDPDIVAGSLSKGNNVDIHGIAAGNDIDVSALGPALDGSGGDDDQILFDVHEHVDVYELIREEDVVFIRESGFELVGARRGIDLVVDGSEFTVGNLGEVVAVVGLDGKLSAPARFDQNLLKLVLRQGENNRNRLKLRDHEKPFSVR